MTDEYIYSYMMDTNILIVDGLFHVIIGSKGCLFFFLFNNIYLELTILPSKFILDAQKNTLSEKMHSK